MPPVLCEGCNAQVKRSRLYPHLRLSQNPKCKDYLERLTYDYIQPPDSYGDNDNNNNDKEPSPFQFADADDLAVDPGGDFFGDYDDYTAEEFGMDVDEGGHDTTERDLEGEEEQDDIEDTAFEVMLAEEEDGLEPERTMKPVVPIQSEAEEPALSNPTHSNSAQRLRGGAEGPLQNRPYIMKFGGKAGAVYERGAEDANNQYLNAIGNRENLYAPFGSKLEWDIARWAKLRGPSSTAFSELMQIEGVSTSQPDNLNVMKLTRQVRCLGG